MTQNIETKANGEGTQVDKASFKAFVESLSKDSKAPSYIVPKDLATWFDRDDRKVRDALRKMDLYAVEHKDGKGHRYGLSKDEMKATKGIFDYLASRFANGSTGTTSRGRSYLEIDWSNL